MTGPERKPWPLIVEGKFSGFTWPQDDADEFDQEPTGHTVTHKSLSVKGGDNPISSLEELVSAPREKDILYIPFLHYMNVVNPSKGIITASSRFGALLLKPDRVLSDNLPTAVGLSACCPIGLLLFTGDYYLLEVIPGNTDLPASGRFQSV